MHAHTWDAHLYLRCTPIPEMHTHTWDARPCLRWRLCARWTPIFEVHAYEMRAYIWSITHRCELYACIQLHAYMRYTPILRHMPIRCTLICGVDAHPYMRCTPIWEMYNYMWNARPCKRCTAICIWDAWPYEVHPCMRCMAIWDA
jgi:hypothetical protein